MVFDVYGRSGCSQCMTTKIWLTKRGADFIYHEDEGELQAKAEQYDYQQAPVVVVSDNSGVLDSWSGFRCVKIDGWLGVN